MWKQTYTRDVSCFFNRYCILRSHNSPSASEVVYLLPVSVLIQIFVHIREYIFYFRNSISRIMTVIMTSKFLNKYGRTESDSSNLASHHVSGGWLCTTWMILPGGYSGVEAERAILRSLGWSHRRLLGGADGWAWGSSSSSGSSDLGMHLVPPAMILHCCKEKQNAF